MLRNIADSIICFLERRNVLHPSERAVYLYGCESALYTIVSTLGLVLIGMLLGRFWEAVFLIGLFYVNQTIGSGFHASTHLRCFLTMATGLLFYIASFYLLLSSPVLLVLGIGSLALLFRFPLILHENKQYLAYKAPIFVKHSRILTVVEGLLFLACSFLPYHHLTHMFAVALMLCAASRCAGVYRRTCY